MPIRIAIVVRETRESKGITQEKLAEMIGKSSGYVGQVERGETLPSATVLADLIDVLGVDANTLFYEDTSQSNISKEISIRASRLSPEKQEFVLSVIGLLEQAFRKGQKDEDCHL